MALRAWPACGPAALVLALVALSPARAQEASFLGPASCSSTSCHGSLTPRQVTRVPQDEYRTWAGLGPEVDRHSRAFKVLGDPLGQRIARNLGLGKATGAGQCLACHEPPVPAERRGPRYALGDGVSCEHCHGAASGWIDAHAKGAPHAENVRAGMVDTKNVARRAARCLQCHLGTADRRVDHALIAAGHPDLTFELDTFTAAMPPHFGVDRDPAAHLRTWAIGQAAQIKAQMEYLATISREGRWPDYARLDCAACHHPLTVPVLSWRLKQDKLGRAPGRPPFNTAQHAVFRHLARAVAPAEAASLEQAVAGVNATLSSSAPGRGAATVAATRAAGLAAGLVERVGAATYDSAIARRLLLEVARDADGIANQGPRAALQTVWLADLLLRMPLGPRGGPVSPELRGILTDLYRQADLISEFKAAHFADQLRRLAAWAEHTGKPR